MRTEFTKKTKLAALERAAGRCEGVIQDGSRCPNPLVKGQTTHDHIIPDWMGGNNSLENSQVLCRGCDKPKTATDAKNRAKVKRIIKKREGTMRPKAKIKSRGFGGWRKFNGKIVRR